jgi:hypothetical protein
VAAPAAPDAYANSRQVNCAMLRTLILIASMFLIGAGVSLIIHDLRRSRRKTVVVAHDGAAGAEAEVEILVAPNHALQLSDPDAGVLRSKASPADARREAARLPAALRSVVDALSTQQGKSTIEQQWSDIQPMVLAGVAKVNAVLSLAGLSLSAPGEPCWSYKKEGFGTYRRLLLGKESLARLRLELSQDGKLHAYVKAQASHHADLNGAASTAMANLTAAAAGDVLSACLKPAAAYIARIKWNRDDGNVAGGNSSANVDDTITAAIGATNGAFAQADARLLPLAPAAWDGRTQGHRMELVVEVAKAEVARMHIERLAHEIEVAVGVREATLINLGRRRRIALEGMTTHSLAELIAGCAWPSIAHYRQARRSA